MADSTTPTDASMASPTTLETKTEKPKKAVPKFGSFKPPAPTPTEPTTSEKPEKKDRHHHHRSSDRKHRESRHRHRSRTPPKRCRSESPTSPISPTRLLDQALSLPQPKPDTELFTLDYGTAPKPTEPTPEDEERLKREKKEAEYRATKERKREWERQRRQKEWAKKREQERKEQRLGVGLKVKKGETVTKIIPSKTASKAAEENLDFIGFDESEEEKEEEPEKQALELAKKVESESEEEEKDAYFAFRELRDRNKGKEEKVVKDFSVEVEKARERNAELDRAAKADPYNPSAWLEFVDYQDVLLEAGRKGRRITQAERTSSAEVKLAILEKALKNMTHEEKLIARYMEIAATLWEPAEVHRKWESLLKANPAKYTLWHSYLAFRTTDFQTFTYPDLRRGFGSCLALLRNEAFKIIAAHDELEELPELERIVSFVLERALHFIRDSGFSEMAVALMQALLEVNFARPERIEPPRTLIELNNILTEFGSFWDEEVPRIGEEGAKGWTAFTAGTKTTPPARPSRDVPDEPINPKYPFDSWTAKEAAICQPNALPARTTDPIEENDPFAIVLFSDIKDLVYVFHTDTYRLNLIDIFLRFSGLPSYHQTSTNAITQDPFLLTASTFTPSGLSSFFPTDEEPTPFTFPLPTFPPSLSTLFPAQTPSPWFNTFSSLPHITPTIITLAHQTLLFLSKLHLSTAFLTYTLALTHALTPTSTKKTAKSLLKSNSTSLPLWTAYALSQPPQEARKIFATALTMSASFPASSSRNLEILQLWEAWIVSEFYANEPNAALTLLTSLETGAPPGSSDANEEPAPAAVLKAKRYLQEKSFQLDCQQEGCLYSHLLALLTYLTPSTSSSPALPTFTPAPSNPELVYAHEVFLQAIARLYLLNTTKRHATSPLPAFRTFLEGCIRAYPGNTSFWGLYVYIERSYTISGRVRSLLEEVGATKTVLGGALALWAEVRLVPRGLVNISGVRRVAEEVVGGASGGPSELVWWVWVESEIRAVEREGEGEMWEEMSEGEREKKKSGRKERMRWSGVREVVGRAVRGCPWSKRLIMVPFQRLGRVLDYDELKRFFVLGVMEKELRFHESWDFEEYLQRKEESEYDRKMKEIEEPTQEEMARVYHIEEGRR
ncbi:DUF1740-domain-containing protein [Ascobolus immersus RN42]|uniref:DUF1740-domain-containing protein n=1 Tax=Ascobolus immersus RN42 TaxID=1160509 RepID=A0A3N4HKA3_ASCIM|nr:DUF1740-domain-containing protein [Ascobolus immersus RN42]